MDREMADTGIVAITRHEDQTSDTRGVRQVRAKAQDKHQLIDPGHCMLMLSHCIPDQFDNANRHRAWQLLQLASHSYRVYLACVYDGPANLDQWRATYELVDRLALQSRPFVHRWVAWIIG